MQFLVDLWLPILASGLVVFVLSALAWTVLPHHKSEFTGLANEDAVMDALRATGASPGRYVVPWMDSGKTAQTPEGKAKLERGPIALITVRPPGLPPMGPLMAQSFASGVVIAIFVAYLAWHTLAPGTDYLAVFRVAGTATFMAYALGGLSDSIWFGRPWKSNAIHWLDSAVYALATGGIFGALWP